jgi:hypothetical protein
VGIGSSPSSSIDVSILVAAIFTAGLALGVLLRSACHACGAAWFSVAQMVMHVSQSTFDVRFDNQTTCHHVVHTGKYAGDAVRPMLNVERPVYYRERAAGEQFPNVPPQPAACSTCNTGPPHGCAAHSPANTLACDSHCRPVRRSPIRSEPGESKQMSPKPALMSVKRCLTVCPALLLAGLTLIFCSSAFAADDRAAVCAGVEHHLLCAGERQPLQGPPCTP